MSGLLQYRPPRLSWPPRKANVPFYCFKLQGWRVFRAEDTDSKLLRRPPVVLWAVHTRNHTHVVLDSLRKVTYLHNNVDLARTDRAPRAPFHGFFCLWSTKIELQEEFALFAEGAFGAFVRTKTGSSGYNSTPICADAGGPNRVVKRIVHMHEPLVGN